MSDLKPCPHGYIRREYCEECVRPTPAPAGEQAVGDEGLLEYVMQIRKTANPEAIKAFLARNDGIPYLSVSPGEFRILHRQLAAACAEIERLRRSRMADLLAIRGVDDPCRGCGGTGETTYGSTAMWRGGIGGQALTSGPCDKCWGSGKEGEPWPSHRGIAAKDTLIDTLVKALRGLLNVSYKWPDVQIARNLAEQALAAAERFEKGSG